MITDSDRWHLNQAWAYLRNVKGIDAAEADRLTAFVNAAKTEGAKKHDETPVTESVRAGKGK